MTLQPSQPYPALVQAALAGLSRLAPAEAMVVGDTPSDAQAGCWREEADHRRTQRWL